MSDSSGLTRAEVDEEVRRLRRENEALRAVLDGDDAMEAVAIALWNDARSYHDQQKLPPLPPWEQAEDEGKVQSVDIAKVVIGALRGRAASLQGRTVTRG